MKLRSEEYPSAQWTSMIDIIFQLLIFFMVTLAMGIMQQQAAAAVEGKEKKDIPKLPPVEKLSTPQDALEGFLLNVDKIQEKPFEGDLGAYILDADCPTVDDAKKDSTHSRGPFPLDRAKRDLQKKIEDRIFRGEPIPRLEIRAHKDTPFGFVLDVLEFCDQDSIEVVGFRFANIRQAGPIMPAGGAK